MINVKCCQSIVNRIKEFMNNSFIFKFVAKLYFYYIKLAISGYFRR